MPKNNEKFYNDNQYSIDKNYLSNSDDEFIKQIHVSLRIFEDIYLKNNHKYIVFF